ncbi:hypothetical protein KAR34_11965 [bacterium]|nr:hypothetical protein [bacterium]
MRAQLLSVICLAGMLMSSVCQARMDAEKFRLWYEKYYQAPSAEEALSAFDYYVTPQPPAHSLWKNESAKLAYARFFAVLAEAQPELLRRGERLFRKASWQQKKILLEIFKRSQDEQLRTNLRYWALQEKDDDRKIRIEQAALTILPMEALFASSIRTTDTLEEQWACFFALGNPRVVNASIDLLGNTVLGYCRLKTKEGTKRTELYPRERRLRERAKKYLIHRAPRHPLVHKALLQHPWLQQSKDGQSLLEMLAYQALDLFNADQANIIFNLLQHWDSNSLQRKHYLGAIAVLEQRYNTAQSILRELEQQDRLYSEWLRAYQAYVKQLEAQKMWQKSAVPAGGHYSALLCSQALGQAKSLGIYEVWKLRNISNQERLHIHCAQHLTIIQTPDIRFHMQFKTQPQAAWIMQANNTRRWTRQNEKWITIENKLVSEQIKSLAGIEEIKNFLTTQYPTAIYKIIGPESEYAVLVYKKIKSSRMLEDSLELYFPGQTHKIKELRFWADTQKGNVLRMQVEITITQHGRRVAEGVIDRIFYNYNAMDLSWTKKMK